MEKISIDGNGGFDGWQAETMNIPGQSAWILLLSVNDPTTAVEEPENIQGIKLAPNPAHTSFNIIFDQPTNQSRQVRIYSSSGVLFFDGTINQYTLEVQTSTWPIGLYFVQVKSERGVETGKIFIHDSQ